MKQKEKNNFVSRKRKREINNFESETFFENEFVNDYNKFIEENNLNFSDIIISEPEQIKFSKSKINKKELSRYLNDNNLVYENFSEKLNNNINSIKRAYSFENILFFKSNKLLQINEYLKLANNLENNIFNIRNDGSKLSIISNINIKKGAFIINIVGLYCYRKTENYSNINLNGFSNLFLFNCHDKNYDRFLKCTNAVNLGSIIANSKEKGVANCKIIRYLDLDLTVNLGLIAITKINKGENFILLK